MKATLLSPLSVYILSAVFIGLNAQTTKLRLEESHNGLDSWQAVDLDLLSLSPDGRIIRPPTTLGGGAFFRLQIEVLPEPDDGSILVQGGSLPPESQLGEQQVHSFRIGCKEVTFAEWDAVHVWGEANGYSFERFRPFVPNSKPVTVNWFDAIRYCNARSEKEGLVPAYVRVAGENSATLEVYRRGVAGFMDILVNQDANGYRLPTEAEWEFAARGGNSSGGTLYSGSNDPATVAWFLVNAGGGSNDVGTRAPNELGLFDMSGNVAEWCWDMIFPFPGAQHRIKRGGSWESTAPSISLSSRGTQNPFSETPGTGFRVARTVPASP